ncbi:hypothetical protein B0J14DRAFT_636229 [Halenospora varia]|nr:hypothetical protein B0J14DRAFT_636229 [Halenospora varia]
MSSKEGSLQGGLSSAATHVISALRRRRDPALGLWLTTPGMRLIGWFPSRQSTGPCANVQKSLPRALVNSQSDPREFHIGKIMINSSRSRLLPTLTRPRSSSSLIAWSGNLKKFDTAHLPNLRRELHSSSRQPFARSVVVNLLRVIDSKYQIQSYLSRFGSVETQALAIVAVERDALLPGNVDVLAAALVFLKHVGLLPIVVHSHFATPDIGASINQGGKSHRSLSLKNARSCIRHDGIQLASAIEDLGEEARPITCGVFQGAKQFQEPGLKQLAYATSFSRDAIDAAIRAGCIPVLSALGHSDGSRVLPLDVNLAATALATTVKPQNVMFVSESRRKKEVMEELIEDASHEMSPRQDERSLRTSHALGNLLHEPAQAPTIFLGNIGNLQNAILQHIRAENESDSGTVLQKRRHVRVLTSLSQAEDVEIIRSVARSHWKDGSKEDRETKVHHFIETLKGQPFVAYVEGKDSQNIAIVTTTPVPFLPVDEAAHYMQELPLFAVSDSGWHDGTAEYLWDLLIQDNPRIWGTVSERDENLEWWFERAEGSIKQGTQINFWCGNVLKTVHSDFEQSIQRLAGAEG